MVNLGDKVKDPVTGLTGIVTGKTEWLWGCRTIVIQPAELKDGKPVDTVCLDEDRVEVVKAGKIAAPESAPTRPGGPSRPMSPVHR